MYLFYAVLTSMCTVENKILTCIKLRAKIANLFLVPNKRYYDYFQVVLGKCADGISDI